MNLLVLGASGGCGTWICRLAHERGHTVRAVVRPGSRPPDVPDLDIVCADVLAAADWPRLLMDQEGVLSALGIKRRNPRNPFSALASPPDLTARAMRYLVASAPDSIRRIAVVSAAGVGDSFPSTAAMIRRMILNSNMNASYRDLEAMEQVLASSGLDWLAVRPTTLVDMGPTGRCRTVDSYGLFNRVTRGDVAEYMLDAVESSEPFLTRTPILATVRE